MQHNVNNDVGNNVTTMRILILSIFIVAFCTGPVYADEAQDIARIKARLGEIFPQDPPESIKATPVPEWYEVMYGAEVLYLSADGRYVLQGSLIDLETREDLTEAARMRVRASILKDLDESQMIAFSPPDPRHTLTVFTDIDCGYCRKFHAEMEQLNGYGIKVRYMMFPRSGANTPSYQKAINVWCAEDQQTSMTRAKAGESVPQADCKNPVKAQLAMGKQLGVTGTPALFTEDGALIPGYRPAKDLADTLDSASETK